MAPALFIPTELIAIGDYGSDISVLCADNGIHILEARLSVM